MKYASRLTLIAFVPTALILLAAPQAAAADSSSPSQAQDQQQGDTQAEKVNVEQIKEKYWARGDESEMGVVQNRTYTKAGKWEVGVFGGFILTDPFLNVTNAGLSLGYHFSEYFAVDALYWKSFASASSALNTFQQYEGATTNYNKPLAYYGAEAVGSFLYGKLSVMGKSIIYYDMHLIGGLGITQTQNGNYVTPDIGLGEQVYLSKSLSLRLDYRLMYYREEIEQDVVQTQLGDPLGKRNNFSNVIDFGVSFMFGGPKDKEGSQ